MRALLLWMLAVVLIAGCEDEKKGSDEKAKTEAKVAEEDKAYQPPEFWKGCESFDTCEPKCPSGTDVEATSLEDGSLVKTCLLSGKMHSVAFIWGADGRISRAIQMHSGERKGWFVAWKGDRQTEVCEYKSNEPHGHCSFFEDGELIGRGQYVTGSPVGDWKMKIDGKMTPVNIGKLTEGEEVRYAPIIKTFDDRFFSLFKGATGASPNCKALAAQQSKHLDNKEFNPGKIAKDLQGELKALDREACDLADSIINSIRLEAMKRGRSAALATPTAEFLQAKEGLEKCIDSVSPTDGVYIKSALDHLRAQDGILLHLRELKCD